MLHKYNKFKTIFAYFKFTPLFPNELNFKKLPSSLDDADLFEHRLTDGLSTEPFAKFDELAAAAAAPEVIASAGTTAAVVEEGT